MTAELAMRDGGVAEMAYIGAVPWHGLGQELQEGASKEDWRKAAGFDFDFVAAPVDYKVGDETHSMAERRVIYRSDNKEAMSIVSDQYHIVQPAAVLDYFDELAQRAGFKLNTAGLLFGGKKFWGMANIGADSVILDDADTLRGRLLMATSVDLSLPTTIKFLSERVVCNNTLSYGLRQGGTTVKRNHRRQFEATEVNEELGIMMLDEFQHLVAEMQDMASTAMTYDDMTLANAALCTPDMPIYRMDFDEMQSAVGRMDQEELVKLAEGKTYKRVLELAWERDGLIGDDLKGGRDTAYAWLNGVTQFVDHESGSRTPDWRMNRAWFGDGDTLKSRAFEIASKFVR